MTLPKHIISAIEKNKTSIGDNPCLPPEDEKKFLLKLLTNYFNKITTNNNFSNIETLQDELSSLIVKCKKIERHHIDDLEKICIECVNEIFNIPEDTIDIKASLVNNVDVSSERLYPESIDDFSFDTIEDMEYLTQEIYKRRFINALISGIALYYASNFKPYFQKVFEIDSELPSLYKKIMTLNNVLLYLSKDSLNVKENNDGGKVDVYIKGEENMIQLQAEALLFPILLNETIKGLLELSISHGLPKDREKANYIIAKSDFKMAEIWDLRLGIVLWERISDILASLDIDIANVGINFFTMYLSTMSPDEFNNSMREILANTKRGKEILKEICTEIVELKEQDEFDDYMISQQNNQLQINDDDYFEADELIIDSVY